jgi:hypothetical protein
MEELNVKFENALKKMGINPEDTRCADQGQWILYKDDTEVYIDMWKPEERSQWQFNDHPESQVLFQVVSPCCFMPKGLDRSTFLSELLHLNFHMYYANFTYNEEENMAAVRFKGIAAEMSEYEMINALESVSFYSQNLSNYLAEKYAVEKVTAEKD